MIELEIYAAGVRDTKVILELDHVLEGIPELRYKVDRNHDIVYFEVDQPKFNVQDILAAFERLNLKPRVVGNVPQELNKKKTQLLR
ncbi:MAG: hypothetical protein PHQ12_05420 [Chthoniobacteraceae bacterium]|nr:hypothetical protein [Chthoniobacteraceae bacterium]